MCHSSKIDDRPFPTRSSLKLIFRFCHHQKKREPNRWGVHLDFFFRWCQSRAVTRSENLGGHIVLGGDNVPPLVEIGLTDLPKSGGHVPPRPPRLRRACKGETPPPWIEKCASRYDLTIFFLVKVPRIILSFFSFIYGQFLLLIYKFHYRLLD